MNAPRFGHTTPAERRELVDVALGRAAADLYLRGGRVVNVYSGEVREANVAVRGERIAYVGASEKSVGGETRVIEAGGRFVSPGWIETHSHAYLIYTPRSLSEAVLPGGTTTVVSDDLIFSQSGGADLSRAVMDAAAELPVRFLWHARPEPASPLTPDNHPFDMKRLRRVLDHPLTVGLGEAPAWARFLQGDPGHGEAIAAAQEAGVVVEGHTSGARDERLAAMTAAGLRSCHEGITAEEAAERLRLGLWTPLRHSSLRPDLPELLRTITDMGLDTRRILLTTDAPAPDVLAERGFVDGMLRMAVEAGVPPVQAIQLATINAATYLYLDDHLGGIAPGRFADLLLLEDLQHFQPETVIRGGQVVLEDRAPTAGVVPAVELPEMKPGFRPGDWLAEPSLYVPKLSEDPPVIDFVSDVITKLRYLSELPEPSDTGTTTGEPPPGYLWSAHVDRLGKWVVRALVGNLAPGLEGFATTMTSSGHLLALGRDPRAMATAAARVRDLGGGIAFATAEQIEWEAALTIGGTMSAGDFATAAGISRELKRRLVAVGYAFGDPIYSLLFITADFLPSARFTAGGVLDVRNGAYVREAEELGS